MSTVTADAHSDAHAEHAHGGSFLKTYVFSLDHKVIGLQFLFSTLIWFFIGGMLALGIRWQLAYPWAPMPILGELVASPEGGQIAPENYTMLVTMHATVMIFFVIIPVLAGAFGNFLIPLMIGADDMAVPTLNMLSYWFMWPAFLLIGYELFRGRRGCLKGGWTAYPPLSVFAGIRADAVAVRRHVCGNLFDDGFDQLHDDHHPDARAGHDDVSSADDDLGYVHHRNFAGFCSAGVDGCWLHASWPTVCLDRIFPGGRCDGEQRGDGFRRRSTAVVAALVLVL